jgi:hypothetical protein
MEQYIDKLSLSSEIKLALRNIHITKVSDLDGLDYLTLAEKFPKGYNVTAIANELNSLGYLYPPENEISVYDISMSKRLQNALIQNNILYLSQLSKRPREKILNFRNLGKSTIPELDSICQKYGIQIGSLAPIKEAFDSCHFPVALHTIFFQNNIFCMDDFKHKTAHDLYAICQRDYALTMKTYYTLKKNGVMFEDWEDKYLFEILPKKNTSLIWQKYEISTVSQLPACNKQQLEEIISAFSELSEFIKL